MACVSYVIDVSTVPMFTRFVVSEITNRERSMPFILSSFTHKASEEAPQIGEGRLSPMVE
jgi:hypothetical protein